MFSGIIQATGKVKKRVRKADTINFEIECPELIKEFKVGDSIAVNGVCLTVEKTEGNSFFVSITKKTEKETNLGIAKTGDIVNLETPLKIGDKISGHFLTGHIDFKTKIVSFSKFSQTGKIILSIPETFMKYFVKRGSIGVDGISLTIAEIKGNRIEIYIIPFTIENTNLKYRKAGDIVNIEIDIMAKYIENFLKNG